MDQAWQNKDLTMSPNLKKSQKRAWNEIQTQSDFETVSHNTSAILQK